MTKPILCLDFDGVIHGYQSGWRGPTLIPDPPVPGAMAFIIEALQHFQVAIFSSRSNYDGGIQAMQHWLQRWLTTWEAENPEAIVDAIQWPLSKPAAFVTIDDRAITFMGTWPDMEFLKSFKPWNKR